MAIRFRLDGEAVEVGDTDRSLLDVLREDLGVTAVKDGCSPQGQCGCCTVLVDGSARVACVTPARRVDGRVVATVRGMPEPVVAPIVEALLAHGGSQCGFCTPGIVVRLVALGDRLADRAAVERALLAHLCRCTGWRTIVDAASAAAAAGPSTSARDLDAAARRAGIEGGVPQRVGTDVVLGEAGFADDTAPRGALVAVPSDGGWAVGATLAAARAAAGKVQGRRTTAAVTYPLEVAPGAWDLVLRTTWVEPAYLETDASWCAPGGVPANPLANGGAFGAKAGSVVAGVAATLANEHGRPVRALLSREDAVRLGPKRPPIAAGLRHDGSGVVRVVRTPGVADAIRSVLPLVQVEEVEVAGPPTSAAIRGAGWVEAAVLRAALAGTAGVGRADVDAPGGGGASVVVTPEGVSVWVRCGSPLDEVVLRSYCVGAVHMALGWVRAEAIAVDVDGSPLDLTIRSFGVLRAADVPPVDVTIEGGDGEPVNGSDAVFAATAAAAWLAAGLPAAWPTQRI